MTLKIQKLEKLEKAPSKLKKINVHFIAEIDKKIGSSDRSEGDVEGGSCIGVYSLAFIEETEAVCISDDAHAWNKSK